MKLYSGLNTFISQMLFTAKNSNPIPRRDLETAVRYHYDIMDMASQKAHPFLLGACPCISACASIGDAAARWTAAKCINKDAVV
jgi:hypothetical protein